MWTDMKDRRDHAATLRLRADIRAARRGIASSRINTRKTEVIIWFAVDGTDIRTNAVIKKFGFLYKSVTKRLLELT